MPSARRYAATTPRPRSPSKRDPGAVVEAADVRQRFFEHCRLADEVVHRKGAPLYHARRGGPSPGHGSAGLGALGPEPPARDAARGLKPAFQFPLRLAWGAGFRRILRRRWFLLRTWCRPALDGRLDGGRRARPSRAGNRCRRLNRGAGQSDSPIGAHGNRGTAQDQRAARFAAAAIVLPTAAVLLVPEVRHLRNAK